MHSPDPPLPPIYFIHSTVRTFYYLVYATGKFRNRFLALEAA